MNTHAAMSLGGEFSLPSTPYMIIMEETYNYGSGIEDLTLLHVIIAAVRSQSEECIETTHLDF